MHILFSVNNYPPKVGGVELHVHALVRYLTASGHRVTVVTLGQDRKEERRDGARVFTFPEHFRFGGVFGVPSPAVVQFLRRYIATEGVDVVSVHTRFFPMTWAGDVAARSLKIPVGHTEHGSDYVSSNSRIVSTAAYLVDQTLGRASLRSATAVLAVSESVADFVYRLSRVRAQLFYNAIDASPCPPVSRDPNKLLFIGRIVAGKGWREFVYLVNGLVAQGMPVRGTLIGGGPQLEQLRQYESEHLRVLGAIAPKEVPAALRGGILVNPTSLSEGFQTTLLEALSQNSAVVTFPVPGAKRLAEDGAPVVITEKSVAGLETGIKQLWEHNPQSYPAKKMEQWTWSARGAQFVSILRELLS